MASCKASSAGQEPGLPSSRRGEMELAELGPLLKAGRDRSGEASARVNTDKSMTRRERLAQAASGDDCQVSKGCQEDEEEDEEEEEVRVLTLPLQAHHAMEKMEEFVYKVWEGRWRVIPYDVLPDWLKDNDYLLHGHRPPMPSFRACFRSIFRIHTETGNIWTHLLGFVLFLFLGVLTMLRPNMYFMAPLQEKVVFGMFFLGAVLCLSFSWLFHTVYCHSEKVSRTFSK
ncbi:hypothetical protein FKM82_016749 [Ascaphus truei]